MRHASAVKSLLLTFLSLFYEIIFLINFHINTLICWYTFLIRAHYRFIFLFFDFDQKARMALGSGDLRVSS